MALAKSQVYQDAADSPATLRAYVVDLVNYKARCDMHGFVAMRPHPRWSFWRRPAPFSPHGLRAGFVTTACRKNGVPDEEIMGHTRHRSLTTIRSYVRRAKLSQTSPAGKLGL
jgi:integrase